LYVGGANAAFTLQHFKQDRHHARLSVASGFDGGEVVVSDFDKATR
jgi:hypothetical protein